MSYYYALLSLFSKIYMQDVCINGLHSIVQNGIVQFNPLPAIDSILSHKRVPCTVSSEMSQRVHKVAKIDACIVKHNFSTVFWHAPSPKRVWGGS